MSALLEPLRNRRAWIIAGIVVVLVLGPLLFFGPHRVHEGVRLVSAVLLSLSLGLLAAAFVLFLRGAGVPQPGTLLTGLEPARRRAVRDAVISERAVSLPDSERPYAIEFARAYRAWLPGYLAPFVVMIVGVFLQALAQLRSWDGGFVSVCLVIEFVTVAVVLFVLVPLQLRRFRRAHRLAAPGS